MMGMLRPPVYLAATPRSVVVEQNAGSTPPLHPVSSADEKLFGSLNPCLDAGKRSGFEDSVVLWEGAARGFGTDDSAHCNARLPKVQRISALTG
eukprot:3446702-Rhodomonas_salina.3